MIGFTKKKTIYMLCAAMTGMLLSGCGAKVEEKVMSDEIVVETKEPVKGELVLNNQFIGSISPQEAVYVVPLVAGEIKKNYVEIGQEVKEGDTLCKIDDKAAQLQLTSAKASYQTAEANANQVLGSSMDLQYIQMEANRDSLKKQKEDYEKKLREANTDLSQLQQDEIDTKDKLEDAKDSYEGSAKSYVTAQAIKAKLNPILAPLASEGITSQGGLASAIDGAYAASGADPGAENKTAAAEDVIKSEDPNVTMEQREAAAKYITYIGYQSALNSAGVKIEDLSDANIALLKSGMDMQSSGISSTGSATASIKSGISSMEGAIDQYKSAIDQTQDGIDVAQKTAEVTYGKTVEETRAIIAAQLNAANVGVQSAQMQLDMYTLTAPISGTVEAVNITENGLAASGSAAYVISNNDTMTVTFYVSEDIRNTFVIGQKILINRNGSDYSGNITEISSMVDQQTGLFKIKASVQGGENALLAGTSVTITADTYREGEGLLIPYDAVYYDNGQPYVYCEEEGKAVKKEIQTGIFNDTTISVLAGITADSSLITSWSPNLRDGAVVKIKGAEAKAPQANETEDIIGTTEDAGVSANEAGH